MLGGLSAVLPAGEPVEHPLLAHCAVHGHHDQENVLFPRLDLAVAPGWGAGKDWGCCQGSSRCVHGGPAATLCRADEEMDRGATVAGRCR